MEREGNWGNFGKKWKFFRQKKITGNRRELGYSLKMTEKMTGVSVA